MLWIAPSEKDTDNADQRPYGYPAAKRVRSCHARSHGLCFHRICS